MDIYSKLGSQIRRSILDRIITGDERERERERENNFSIADYFYHYTYIYHHFAANEVYFSTSTTENTVIPQLALYLICLSLIHI